MINTIINQLQTKASNPNEGAWVSASAGTGKTKILTDRVVRLLLEGVSPLKILCLTFTNAAAGEMHERIIKALKKLSDVSSDKELMNLITSTTGQTPSHKIINKAKSLYKEYLTSEDTVAIHTLHSYCQKILQRFPIEAGITPNFNILDEAGQSDAILAIKDIMLKDKQLENLNKFFAENFHQSTLDEIFISILNSRKDFLNHDSKYEISKDTSEVDIDELIEKASGISYSKYTEILNYPLVQILIGSLDADLVSKSNLKSFDYQHNLAIANESSVTQLKLLFLTQKGEKRKRIAPAKIAPQGSNTYDELLYLQERIYQMDQGDRKQQVDSYSAILMMLAKYCMNIYEDYKKDNGYLDYDDLIIKTRELLCDASSRNWVLYKLDGGVNHLLVDEAQDTSKSQWEIIEAIIEEFFAGNESDSFSVKLESNRTLFVVGDQKQSIFSFQGADVKCFIDMNNKLTNNLALSGIKFNNIELDVSYRSASAIIDVVYAVFRNIGDSSYQDLKQTNYSSKYSIFENIPYLKAHRNTYHGSVELWPLYTKEKMEEEFWPVVNTAENSSSELKTSAQERLAKDIAGYIDKEITSGKILDSTGKKVCAGDFLVLFRTRSKLTDLVIEEIQQLSIEVTGLDRIKLKDDMLVQDILAFAKFAINPHDDLNLAGLLKSPFFGKSEEEIYQLKLESKNFDNHLCDVTSEKLLDTIHIIYKSFTLCDFFQYLAKLLELKDRLHIYYPTASPNYLSSAVSFDSFRELLSAASNYQKQKSSSLQGFVEWFENSDIEIKRSTSSSSMVRIMTVHGSKGLQSPYVILCDTTSLPNSYDRILKDENNGRMISAKNAAFTDDNFKNIQQARKDMEYYEYIRLLYVALTRAEDHLVICGYNNKKSIAENSWYSLVKPAIEKLIKDTKDDTGAIAAQSPKILCYNNTTSIKEEYLTNRLLLKLAIDEECAGKSEHRTEVYFNVHEDSSTALTHKLPSLVECPKKSIEPLRVSTNIGMSGSSSLAQRATTEKEYLYYKGTILEHSKSDHIYNDNYIKLIDKSVSSDNSNSGIYANNNSPLQAISVNKYDALEYGKVFHKILEDSVKLEDISTMYTHPLIDTISEDNRKRMMLSIDKISTNPEFLELIKRKIKTEVSVGVPNIIVDEHLGAVKQFKIGRIDLMSMDNHYISIIDYKSDKITNISMSSTLEKYKLQLEFYRKALSSIYPNHKLNSYILWLETGKLELVC